MRPIITIIVPIYNVESYINKCIDSILKQTYKYFELILVDDGSTDSSSIICDDYAKKDSRIIVIHKNNEGQSSARNAGLDIAKGDYISFIDGDDYVLPTYISNFYDAINNCDMVVSNFMFLCIDGSIKKDEPFEKSTKTEIDYWRIKDRSLISVCNKLFKKDLFYNLRFAKGKKDEDSLIIHRIVGRCKKISFIPSQSYIYVRRQNSTTSSMPKNEVIIDFLDVWTDRTKFYYEEHFVEELLLINFEKMWRDLKYCIINKIIKYSDRKGDILYLKRLYKKYKQKKKYYLNNVIFLYFPRLYMFLFSLIQWLFKKKS